MKSRVDQGGEGNERAALVALGMVLAAILGASLIQALSASTGRLDCDAACLAVADLAAQRGMERASWAIFAATAVSVLVSFVSLLLIWRTVVHTREAAEAARDAVEEAKKSTAAANRAATEAGRSTTIANDTLNEARWSSRVQNRAYVSILPNGIAALKVRDGVIGHVLIANVGKLPARNVRVAVHMTLSRDAYFSVPTASPRLEPSDRTVQPGTEFRQGSVEILLTSDLPPVDQHEFLYVWGTAEYDDGYGEARQTKFCHRYATDSREQDGDQKTIPADRGRIHETGNAAT